MKKTKPIRMCIICKIRKNQNELKRFWILSNEISFSLSSGRSMYLCDVCLNKENNEFLKSLQKVVKNNIDKKELASKLKERFLNGECKN